MNRSLSEAGPELANQLRELTAKLSEILQASCLTWQFLKVKLLKFEIQ